MGIDFGADEIRIMLHVLGISVWLSGQIVMLGLVPALRKLGGDAPRTVAVAFGRVAWPMFGLVVATGIWNLIAVDLSDVTTGYNLAFSIKMLLVVATGVAAWWHQTTDKPSIRGLTGGIGFVAAVGAFALGILMAH